MSHDFHGNRFSARKGDAMRLLMEIPDLSIDAIITDPPYSSGGMFRGDRTIKEVDGKPWPGHDSDGNVCYENTHFKKAEDAWNALLQDVAAGVKLAASAVEKARKQLADAEKESADACIEYALANKNFDTWDRESNAKDDGAAKPLPSIALLDGRKDKP